MMSSERDIVPFVLIAPTVIANGELPGELIPPRIGVPFSSLPALPADTMTTMPAAVAFATAMHSGSVVDGSVTGCPSDRLITRILYLSRFSMTHSMPAMTSLVHPVPFAPRTRTLMSLTSGAMPPRYMRRDVFRRAVVARDDAGDVRAVPVRVVGRRIAGDLADIEDDFSGQRRMRSNARVEHGDGDARTSDAGNRAEAEKQSALPRANLIGSGRRRRHVHERADRHVA